MSHYNSDLQPKHAVIASAIWKIPGNLYALGKACDAWLQKRYNAEGRKTSNQWTRTSKIQPKPKRQKLPKAAGKRKA
jgi:hypothetical protein